MTTTQYLRSFARFWWLILVCTALGVLLGLLATPATGAKYVASTTVGLSATAPEPGTASDRYARILIANAAVTLAVQRMPTYAAAVENGTLPEDVLSGTDIPLTAPALRDEIDVTVPTGSAIARFTVTDGDRDRALLLASRVGPAAVDLFGTLDLARDPGGKPLLRARVLGEPVISSETEAPPAWRDPVLFGIGGLLVGLALAGAAGRLNPRLRRADAVSAMVGAPVLGDLARRKGRRSGADREHAVDELRTNTYFLRGEEPHLLLAVTSARPLPDLLGTTTEVATALADTGARVLVVDADLGRAHGAADDADDESHPGLAQVLEHSGTYGDAITHDAEGGIDTILAGTPTEDPDDLVHSAGFGALLRDAEEHYDFVLAVAPPTSAGTGAAAVAARCSGTLLVVARGTRSSQVQDALRQLDHVGAQVRGTALTS